MKCISNSLIHNLQGIIFLVYGCLLSSIVGAQVLTLRSDPDTNGSYCPGRIIFTCAGTNVANGLQWLINGTVYDTFTLIRGDTNFPRRISDRNNINISVISATPVINSLGINIVFVLTVESLDPIQDDTISCQSLSRQTSSFLVHVKDVENPENVEVDRIDDDDDDILIRWNITNSQCEGRVYRFSVMLIYFTTTLEIFVNCSNKCVARFPPSTNVDQYMAQVQGINSQGVPVGTPTAIYFSGDGMVISSSISHEIETSACDATFMCISSINGSCVIELIRNNERFSRSGAINSSIAFSNLLPSSFYSYVINFTNLQGGVSNYNFTTGSCGSSTAIVVAVMVSVLVVALVVAAIVIIVVIWNLKKKGRPGEPKKSEAQAKFDLHCNKSKSIKFNNKGMSNVEDNVVQGHKPMGRGSDFILEEKEILTKAAKEIELEKQEQEEQEEQEQQEQQQQQQQQPEEENPIYEDTEQTGNKKDIANKTKATVPLPVGMYSHLNAVHPTSEEYSALQHNTTRAQGQGPPSTIVPGDRNYRQLDHGSVERNKNNKRKPVGNQQNKQGNRKQPDDRRHREAHQH